MKNLNHKLRLPAALAMFLAMQAAYALVPEGYQAVIDGAKKEGKLLVYSVTDTALVRPLIKDFESLYGIKVEYNDMNSTELYNRRAIASRDLHSKHSSPIVFIESGLEPLVLDADLGGFVSAQ